MMARGGANRNPGPLPPFNHLWRKAGLTACYVEWHMRQALAGTVAA